MSRAWALMTLQSEQQYAGNRGYHDDPTRTYRYDSNVANSRNVQAGDLVVLRNGEHVLGVAQIDRIVEKPGTKVLLRCPICGTTALKERQRKRPRFRCDGGHEFQIPREHLIKVVAFEAHYDQTYVALADAISVAQSKAAAMRPNDQLSIEEIDIRRLEQALVRADPKIADLLAAFYQRSGRE